MIIFILGTCVLSLTLKQRDYSMKFGQTSDIQIPLEQQFYSREIENSNKNDTYQSPEFCSVNPPELYVESVNSFRLCSGKCKMQIVENNLVVLEQSGILYVYTFHYKSEPQKVQELYVTGLAGNYDTTSLITDGVQLVINLRSQIYILRESRLVVLPVNGSGIIEQVILHQDELYIYRDSELQVYQLQDKQQLIRKVILGSNCQLSIFKGSIMVLQNQTISRLNTTYHNQQLLHLDGLIQLFVSDQQIYAVQKLNAAYNLLEFNVMSNVSLQNQPDVEPYLVLNQNYSYESQIVGVLSVMPYLFVLHNNLLSMTFAGVPTYLSPIVGKQVFENVESIIQLKIFKDQYPLEAKYEEGDKVLIVDKPNNQPAVENIHITSYLVSLKEENITIHQVHNSKGYISCRPREPYTTGQYKYHYQFGIVNDTVFLNYDQIINFSVFKEIFENSNTALFVGLTIGLTFAFATGLVFCVYFYRIKHKYEQILEEEAKKLNASINLEIN